MPTPAFLSAEPPTDLMAIVDEMLMAYVELRRRKSPRFSLPKWQRCNVRWQAAAKKVRDIGADPYQFVYAQFFSWPGHRHLQLRDLFTPEGFDNHRLTNGTAGSGGLKFFLASERDLSRDIGSFGRDIDSVVCDPRPSFYSPLFRIAHCSDERLPDMLAKYGEAARNELSRDRPLHRYFRRNFPDRAAILLDEPSTCRGNEGQLDRSTPPSIACPPRPSVATR